ncbi:PLASMODESMATA CALLOSE-BINDING PROTEIN 3-like [Gastrolobium bilobum]|uniref:PLASMODESMATA CALLOSE-BINDING PROTEIN 3-like n=1 Tax=Gastrolobium bilobum TaxID=150636 RepID=UPI002AB0F096|nr:PLASMODESMATA CALLOSE-BINDING PROTEIN 3-like [Gastrolobium bilobum]
MAASPKLVCLVLLTATIVNIVITVEAGPWCVVRSGASYQNLQQGMNYACASGADCGPIRPGGSCFNPNTIQNHASYAYDSYYQRHGKAPGTCDFGGTATIAITDPSFGACRYPGSLRTDGEASTTMNNSN